MPINNSVYKIIYPEKISEIEKVIECYKSDIFLALPSGSAIANIIFSNRGRLIDIFGKSKNSYISVWFLVSRELGMEYTLFLADDIKRNSDFRDNDFNIDETELIDFERKINLIT